MQAQRRIVKQHLMMCYDPFGVTHILFNTVAVKLNDENSNFNDAAHSKHYIIHYLVQGVCLFW